MDLPPDPEDSVSFRDLLQEQFDTPFHNRLRRDLLDGILVHIEGRIRYQSSFIGYSDTEVFELFRHLVMSDEEPPIMSDPDQYWCVFHGHPNALACLAHVALKFITLGCSEADVERILSIQKHFQGICRTNYRMETIHSQAFLHESARKL
jgi:hypothetical protein